MIKRLTWILDLATVCLAVLGASGFGWAWNVVKLSCVMQFGFSLTFPFLAPSFSEPLSTLRVYRGAAFDLITALIVAGSGHLLWGCAWMFICISGPVLRQVIIIQNKEKVEAPK